MKIIMSLIILLVSFHSFAKSEKFENHDSVYYSSTGLGLVFGGAGSLESEESDVDLFGLGFDFRASYLMSESVFSNFEIRHASSFIGNNSHMQTLNAQLGVMKSTQFFDPFVLGDVEFNFYNENATQEIWQELNAHFGVRVKIKLIDNLRFSTSVSYLIGANNIGNELRLNQGGNFDIEAIVFNKLKVYLDFEMTGTEIDQRADTGYQVGFYSLGLKFVH